ncbi:hypothetical protein BCR34DRAFT_375174 [Clohesyomyces aquaticus]|uniref:Uncharacterized protein n=1 Tax=Clohesyomyces aquaticus TaxID=1231657 RepID=A0A1Y1ZGJ5_9PLEO|nr:hypothetical protein BCR34DRAFT_375174 [Clohesyomyces aquaticus]
MTMWEEKMGVGLCVAQKAGWNPGDAVKARRARSLAIRGQDDVNEGVGVGLFKSSWICSYYDVTLLPTAICGPRASGGVENGGRKVTNLLTPVEVSRARHQYRSGDRCDEEKIQQRIMRAAEGGRRGCGRSDDSGSDLQAPRGLRVAFGG